MRNRVLNLNSSRDDTAEANPPTPAQALSLVAQAVSELLQLFPVFAALLSQVQPGQQDVRQAQSATESDRALNAAEAAAMLGVSPQWLYRHARLLPFARKLSRKKTVYSEAGIRRWLAMRRPAA